MTQNSTQKPKRSNAFQLLCAFPLPPPLSRVSTVFSLPLSNLYASNLRYPYLNLQLQTTPYTRAWPGPAHAVSYCVVGSRHRVSATQRHPTEKTCARPSRRERSRVRISVYDAGYK